MESHEGPVRSDRIHAVCEDYGEGRRITEEAERIRQRVLKKHGVLDIGVPAIRALRNGHE